MSFWASCCWSVERRSGSVSKQAREARRRRRAAIRLVKGRGTAYDFALLSFVDYWNRAKVRSIARMSKSREGLLLVDAEHEIALIFGEYKPFHNGRKP